MTEDIPDIPGYTIEHLLGEGGMARVYRAIQRGFERPVALKIIAQGLAASEEFGKRFLREARIVGRLSHPHIVPVYDVGEHEGIYYLSMELLTEGDLRSRIGQPLAQDVALDITRQLAGALGYAHNKGFIHRDIKPDNVLFRDADTAVLTDFGIARTVRDSEDMTQITQVQHVIGSPKYMSPEQSMGHQLDARTDIYSLGIILFQMLTGDVPYGGSNLTEISLQRYQQQQPQLPEGLVHLQPLLDRMAAYERDGRFANCEDLLAALSALPEPRLSDVGSSSAAADEATSAMPAIGVATPSPGRENLFGAKSRRRWAALAAVTLVSLLIGSLGYLLRESDAAKAESEGGIAESVQSDLQDTATGGQPAAESHDVEEPLDGSAALREAGATATATSSSAVPKNVSAITAGLPEPSPEEFFAFYDAVNLGLPEAEENFVVAYPESIFTDMLRVKISGDLAYIKRLKQQASAGSARAQLVLSELSDTGWGVPMDKQAALRYAEAAATGGSPFAMYHYATLSLAAANTDAERRAGLRVLERSAQQGFFLAQTVLANYLFEGQLLGRDVEESLRLFERAGQQGDRNALFNLGRIYDTGINISAPDRERAKGYFAMAAELGHPQARNHLQEPL